LREFFEVDRKAIVIAALKALVDEGAIETGVLAEARRRYRGDAPLPTASWQC
jgi:pyruvate dehydrogenase E1 component